MSTSEEETTSSELVFMRRAAGDNEARHGGVWKIAYADFMTAMMAFFLVMWLINASDKKVVTQIATYFNPVLLTNRTTSPTAPHQPGIDEQGSANSHSGSKNGNEHVAGDAETEENKPRYSEEALFGDPYGILTRIADEAASSPKRTGEAYRDPFDPAFRRETQQDRRERDNTAAPPAIADNRTISTPSRKSPRQEAVAVSPLANQLTMEAGTGEVADRTAEHAAAAALEAQIKQAVAQSVPGALPLIEVTVTKEGVLIILTDNYEFGMFAIGSAEPRPAMVVVMEKLGNILAGHPERLIVRGHTDGRPYKSGTYDNWRLSIARSHMAYYMLMRGGIDEKRFERVEGHADRSLRVADDPAAAQNRRIEILLRKAKPQ